MRVLNLPFHNLRQPSSPEEAKMVPVIFQEILQTVEWWSSNWAACKISSWEVEQAAYASFLQRVKIENNRTITKIDY